uniref:IMP dehydrogenase / GMP reductase domain containing protein, putative n=2 Tax=Neospora caninum (strain Liverpool) TaxID=572307 RepID=A0A0F7UH71_NEOCL|nr:TPA: IMP dehydrogenase / GMP reductase domain containing protein, putative [Neospora caninum Liverpool]
MSEIIANAQSAKAKQDAEKKMHTALDASLQASAATAGGANLLANPMNSASLNLTIGRGLSLLNCPTPVGVAQRASQAAQVAADRLLSPSPLAAAALSNLLASNPALSGLVGTAKSQSSGLSVQEKRKLLWGKKGEKADSQEEEKSENGKDEKVVDPNRYSLSFGGDEEKKNKFLKLMGFKGDTGNIAAPSTVPTASTAPGKETLDSAAQQKMNSELEFQYFQGMKRKDGRKTGLGL